MGIIKNVFIIPRENADTKRSFQKTVINKSICHSFVIKSLNVRLNLQLSSSNIPQ